MTGKRHPDIPTTPAGIAGGQGRSPQDVEDSTTGAGITVLVLSAIFVILLVLNSCEGLGR